MLEDSANNFPQDTFVKMEKLMNNSQRERKSKQALFQLMKRSNNFWIKQSKIFSEADGGWHTVLLNRIQKEDKKIWEIGLWKTKVENFKKLQT